MIRGPRKVWLGIRIVGVALSGGLWHPGGVDRSGTGLGRGRRRGW